MNTGRPSVEPTGIAVEVQVVATSAGVPTPSEITAWVSHAVRRFRTTAEVTVRIVELEESALLNARYRGRDGPTNVLAFPFEAPPGVPLPQAELLGDIVVCAPLVARESAEQAKPLAHHWTHLVIHGTLHLLGFDHQNPTDAEDMEGTERALLGELGIDDPYHES